ncbi:MAG: hypothetical protein JST26_08180 [Bacteroidetes bacterium]|nr:hypothetical protein [Bacteroidota bacterium]
MIIFCACSVGEEPLPARSLSAIHKKAIIQRWELRVPVVIRCGHNELSEQFDIVLCARHLRTLDGGGDSCIAKLFIRNKITGSGIDSLELESSYFSSCVFRECNHVRSYTTGYRAEDEVVDGIYGDIVVADLNFDGLDDIAVVNDCGGNGGPLYSYYMQRKNGRFSLSKFLTNAMVFFPDEIDSKRKRLKTLVHAGACCVEENVYQYSPASGRWKRISSRLL